MLQVHHFNVSNLLCFYTAQVILVYIFKVKKNLFKQVPKISDLHFFPICKPQTIYLYFCAFIFSFSLYNE